MSNEDKVDFVSHYVNDAWAFLYSKRYSLLRADIHVHITFKMILISNDFFYYDHDE